MMPPAWIELLYLITAILSLTLALVGATLRSIRTSHVFGFVIFTLVTLLFFGRWTVSGHFPMFGAYESALSLAFFGGTLLVIAGIYCRHPMLTAYPVTVFLLLIHGSNYSSKIYALTISERGFWVHVHAITAFLTFGFALCLFTVALLVFLKYAVSLVSFLQATYLFYTLTILSGSFYRFQLFGKPWSFDPIESMNLACFLCFTTLIHLNASRPWSQRKLAAWTILCVVFMVLAYRLILVFPAWSSYHILDIGLRVHLLP